MNCSEARHVLAAQIDAVPPAERQAAHAHVATCAACRARVDQFGAAIFSAFDDEIPCAECRARLDAYVEAELSGRSPARTLPLVQAHLARCPECAEERQILFAGLLGLRDEALAMPAVEARFDTRFVLPHPPGAGPKQARGAAWAGWLGGWRHWLTQPNPRVARGALAGFAVVVLMLFAGLIASEPSLWLRVQTLAPFNPSLRATAAAELAATETVAASMGRDWVDDLGTPGNPQSAPGGAAVPGKGSATATTTAESPERRATALQLAATRQARDRRAGATVRPRWTPTATITPTLAVTLTVAAPPATERPRREEPTAAPPEPVKPTDPPEPPEEPPGGGYPPPAEPGDPYP